MFSIPTLIFFALHPSSTRWVEALIYSSSGEITGTGVVSLNDEVRSLFVRRFVPLYCDMNDWCGERRNIGNFGPELRGVLPF